MIINNFEFKNNSRTSLEKWIFSSTFPVPKKKKKIRKIQGIPESLGTLKLHVYVWNYTHPPVILHFPTPPNKAKFEIFQHHQFLVSIWGGEGGGGVTLSQWTTLKIQSSNKIVFLPTIKTLSSKCKPRHK